MGRNSRFFRCPMKGPLTSHSNTVKHNSETSGSGLLTGWNCAYHQDTWHVCWVPEAHRVFHDILNRNLKIQKPIPGYSNHQKILRNYYGKLLVVCCSIFLVLIICHYYVSNFAAKRCVISAMAKSYSESSRSSLLTSKWQKKQFVYVLHNLYIPHIHICRYVHMVTYVYIYIQ